MLHVGLDVHKHFSQVAVMDDGGELIDSRRLHHVDRSSIAGYFSQLPAPLIITMESTRNWYWLYELLEEISGMHYRGRPVRCEAQSGFDGRLLRKRPDLAVALKKARFDNPKIAWDGRYSEWRDIKAQIQVLRQAGYAAKDISVFMIFNWDIPFPEMEAKRLKCWEWRVQITDCRYRPVSQLYDNFNARSPQTSTHYYIHPGWLDSDIKQFRRNVRRQNICVRQGLSFHSVLLERKVVSRKLSRELRTLPEAEVRKRLPDAWYPDHLSGTSTCSSRRRASGQQELDTVALLGKDKLF